MDRAEKWEHPHLSVVEVKAGPGATLGMWICLECGAAYDPGASGDSGDPKEWFIPAVVRLHSENLPTVGAIIVGHRYMKLSTGMCWTVRSIDSADVVWISTSEQNAALSNLRALDLSDSARWRRM